MAAPRPLLSVFIALAHRSRFGDKVTKVAAFTRASYVRCDLETVHRPSPQTLLFALPSILEPLNLAQVFPREQPLEVELGSGDGSFLVEYAGGHAERNFIGVERLLGRVQKMSRKGLRAGLANLAGVRIESSYFVEYLLPQHS